MSATLTFEQAIEALPAGEKIHTFLNNIGADWDAAAVVAAIAKSPDDIRVPGPLAQAMGHGIAIPHPAAPSKWLLVKTRYRTDKAEVPS